MSLAGLNSLANAVVAIAALVMLAFAVVNAIKGRFSSAAGIFICALLATGSYAVVTDFAGVGQKVLSLFV